MDSELWATEAEARTLRLVAGTTAHEDAGRITHIPHPAPPARWTTGATHWGLREKRRRRMRRIVSVLAVMAVMAAMVAVMAVPAFAAPREGAGCIGEAFSNAEPGTKGERVSSVAETGTLGKVISIAATRNLPVVTCIL